MSLKLNITFSDTSNFVLGSPVLDEFSETSNFILDHSISAPFPHTNSGPMIFPYFFIQVIPNPLVKIVFDLFFRLLFSSTIPKARLYPYFLLRVIPLSPLNRIRL